MKDEQPLLVKLVSEWMQNVMHLPSAVASLEKQCLLFKQMKSGIGNLEDREKILDDKYILKFHQSHMRKLSMNVQETWKNLFSIENPTRTLCPLLRDLENLDQRLVRTIIL